MCVVGVLTYMLCVLLIRAHQECIEESFLPTIRTLTQAPATSPLAEVDASNVAELLIELTRSSVLIRPNKDVALQVSHQDCPQSTALIRKPLAMSMMCLVWMQYIFFN